MKKSILLITFLFSAICFSQEKEPLQQDTNKSHEVKINAATLLAAKWLDVSYEYLIDEESSFGVGTAVNFSNETELNYSLTPYYRRYFSSKFARGFFVEGFGMLSSYDREYNFFNGYEEKKETSFSVGISVGGKFVSKKGFTTELLLGIGRNLVDNQYSEAVGRVGISLGYRF